MSNFNSVGHYRCTADNRVGQPDTRDIFVNVMCEYIIRHKNLEHEINVIKILNSIKLSFIHRYPVNFQFHCFFIYWFKFHRYHWIISNETSIDIHSPRHLSNGFIMFSKKKNFFYIFLLISVAYEHFLTKNLSTIK